MLLISIREKTNLTSLTHQWFSALRKRHVFSIWVSYELQPQSHEVRTVNRWIRSPGFLILNGVVRLTLHTVNINNKHLKFWFCISFCKLRKPHIKKLFTPNRARPLLTNCAASPLAASFQNWHCCCGARKLVTQLHLLARLIELNMCTQSQMFILRNLKI